MLGNSASRIVSSWVIFIVGAAPFGVTAASSTPCRPSPREPGSSRSDGTGQRLKLRVGQPQTGGSDVVLQMGDRGCARNGQHERRAVKLPGQSQLDRCGPQHFGDSV